MALVQIGLLVGCAQPPADCVPGASAACSCTDGASGAQVCRADRTFGACTCRGDAGPTDAGGADAVVGDGGPCATPDQDHDGASSIACGGHDCDDADPNAHPGNVEVCDTASHDEDCDPTTFGDVDADGDGFFDARCCNADAAHVPHCGNDCDDTHPAVNPASAEVCNGIDEDCDGVVDESVATMVWPDGDGDMFGDPSATPVLGCPGPGLAMNGTDCDDTRAAINPAATEACTGFDDNCDGLFAPGEDADGDHFASAACGGPDCDDANAAVYPGAAEVCNRADDDCDTTIDETFTCVMGADLGACTTACGRGGESLCGTTCEPSCHWLGYDARDPSDPAVAHDCGAASGTSWCSGAVGCALLRTTFMLDAGLYQIAGQFTGTTDGTATVVDLDTGATLYSGTYADTTSLWAGFEVTGACDRVELTVVPSSCPGGNCCATSLGVGGAYPCQSNADCVGAHSGQCWGLGPLTSALYCQGA